MGCSRAARWDIRGTEELGTEGGIFLSGLLRKLEGAERKKEGEGGGKQIRARRGDSLFWVCIFSLKNPGMNTAFFTLLIYSIILQFASVFLSIMLIGVDIGGH